jgi:NAD(P)-dependent dehydrogenase (short-subunit alcohol dehydrogenase family)
MGNDRVAIVTGGSRGIGRGVCVALGREGFAVVVNYASNAAAAAEVVGEIGAAGGRAVAVRADVSVAADRQGLLDQALATYGRVDLLVNNAGIAPPTRADLLEGTEAAFDHLIGVNLKGPYFLSQIVARQMIAQRSSDEATKGHGDEGGEAAASPSVASSLRRSVAYLPKILNVTSVSAYAVSVDRGDYCVAKAGLAMMTQLYAARLAEHGINVYEVRPGVIETDMTGPVRAKYDKLILEQGLTPIRRWGTPDDVARAVVAIARDLLPYSTGEVINVDGGFHVRRL